MRDKRPETGRRAFLALGASAIFAGCVRGGGGGSSDSTTMPDRPTTSTPMPDRSSTATPVAPTTGNTKRRETTSEFVRINSSGSEPQATATVGNGESSTDGSATIRVWNDADAAQKITVGITERNSGTSLFHETYRIEPDAYVEIGTTKPGKYTLDIGVDGGESATIDFIVDTCNSLGVNVAVRRDGTVDSTQISTTMGCPTFATTDTTEG